MSLFICYCHFHTHQYLLPSEAGPTRFHNHFRYKCFSNLHNDLQIIKLPQPLIFLSKGYTVSTYNKQTLLVEVIKMPVTSASSQMENCPICMEPIPPQEHNITRCPNNHVFCRNCLGRWALEATSDVTCPLCRARIRSRPVFRVNNNPPSNLSFEETIPQMDYDANDTSEVEYPPTPLPSPHSGFGAPNGRSGSPNDRYGAAVYPQPFGSFQELHHGRSGHSDFRYNGYAPSSIPFREQLPAQSEYFALAGYRSVRVVRPTPVPTYFGVSPRSHPNESYSTGSFEFRYILQVRRIPPYILTTIRSTSRQ